jgi:hypothetical protein
MEETTLGAEAREIAQRFGVDATTARLVLYRLTVGLADDPTADPDALMREFRAESIKFYERYFDGVYGYAVYRAAIRAAVRRRAYGLIRGNPALKPRQQKPTPAAAHLLELWKHREKKSSLAG